MKKNGKSLKNSDYPVRMSLNLSNSTGEWVKKAAANSPFKKESAFLRSIIEEREKQDQDGNRDGK